MKDRIILHSDVNNFFASVECATNPNLKNKPVAVTGNPEKRTGIILAKNQLAKEMGVKTGEAIWQAKTKCPDLVTVGPHYDLYEKISKKLHNLYLEYTDLVEPVALDECWLDVTPSINYLQKSGKEIADEIREKVKNQFGFSVSVGVSFSKLFAKLGSDLKKPDATTEISRENFKQIAYPMPLDTIIGIGNRMHRKFANMNISTIGDFVNLKESFVKSIMGKTGVELQQKLKGEFDEKVACYYNLEPPKSVGNGTTTIIDIKTRDEVEKVVTFLAEKIALRLTNANFQGRCVSITLKTSDFQRFHHSHTTFPVKTAEEISNEAMKIVDKYWQYNEYVRAVRVRVSNLEKLDKLEQLSFFGSESEILNNTIQQVKNKYGKDKIFIASDTVSFINRKNKDEEHPQN